MFSSKLPSQPSDSSSAITTCLDKPFAFDND